MREISSLGYEILASQELTLLHGVSWELTSLCTYLLTYFIHSLTHSSSTQTGLHLNHVSLAQFNHDIRKCPQYQNPVSSVHAAS